MIASILLFVEAIPKKVYAAAVVALLILSMGLSVSLKLSHMSTERAEAKVTKIELKLSRELTDRATERADRERVAREDAQEVARMNAKHASQQQESLNAFHSQARADSARDRDLRDDTARLRDIAKAYAAGGGAKAQSDGDTCRSEGDRSRRLGELVEEALELSRESEDFIRQRDREVKLLKDLHSADRELVK